MNISRLLQQEFTFPALSKRYIVAALSIIALPNLVFWALSYFTETARPILNLDYLPVSVLLTLPWKWNKWLAVFIFWIALLFDVLVFVIQLFPFMDLAGAIYLSRFLPAAPTIYKIMLAVLAVYFVAMPLALQKIGRSADFFHVLALSSILAIAAFFTGHLRYHEHPNQGTMFGGDNYFYGHSQISKYLDIQNGAFLQAAHTDPVFQPLKFQQATAHLQQPRSNKVLFIINESWGQTQNQSLQDGILEKLRSQSGRFDYWQQGHFPFVGATVEGEMRELCSTGGHGFALRRLPSEKFAHCLPNQFKQAGYVTYALHGASSQMYDRFSWYKKAGFQYFDSAENLPELPRCNAFNGICDSALFERIAQTFAQHDKLFFHWMTLTTHSDYPEEDLTNRRLNCNQYGVKDNAVLCRNFKLQTQFFDGLADLVSRPEMAGVEVLVVGDHTPPTTNLGEVFKYMEKGNVAWVHFKVKDADR